jgi:hypothetical protein
MNTEPASWVSAVLSRPRFAPYLAAAGGNVEAAIELEWWNLQVASAFVVPLNRLELALRNALHPRLAARFRRSDWWETAPLDVNGFPGAARRVVHEEFQRILVLRNRIMHHEPIHHRHLEADHDTVYRLLAHLSKQIVHELLSRDCVPELLTSRNALGRQGEADDRG